VQSKKVKENNK